MISFKKISISLISSFNFRTQKVSKKMNFWSRWYQIMKLWLLNWKMNVILYQISLFECILQAKRKSWMMWHTLYHTYELFLQNHIHPSYSFFSSSSLPDKQGSYCLSFVPFWFEETCQNIPMKSRLLNYLEETLWETWCAILYISNSLNFECLILLIH